MSSLDLDEVLLRGGEDPLTEPLLSFPWSLLYKERLRLGTPALFHQLEKIGYDIWRYSSSYYSSDAVQDFFRRHHVKVAGVITAVGKKNAAGGGGKKLEREAEGAG